MEIQEDISLILIHYLNKIYIPFNNTDKENKIVSGLEKLVCYKCCRLLCRKGY